MADQPLPPTRVELEQLEQAAQQLEQIREFVQRHCLGAMPAINEALGLVSSVDMSGVDYQFTRDATVFGGFYSAYGMQATHDGVYRAVQESLEKVAGHLTEAADATRTILGNYRTMEERNTAMANDILRVLGGGTAVGPDGAGSPDRPGSPDGGSTIIA